MLAFEYLIAYSIHSYFQISQSGCFLSLTTGNLASVKDLLDLGEVDINARGKILIHKKYCNNGAVLT